MFRIAKNYIMVPTSLYYTLFFGGGLLALVSVGMLLHSLLKKKSKKYIICWLIALIVGALLVTLTSTGRIAGHTMFGG